MEVAMKRRDPQQTFAFLRWGGKRKGAGREPKGERAGVPHETRARLAPRFPVHVTVRLQRGLPILRRKTDLPRANAGVCGGR